MKIEDRSKDLNTAKIYLDTDDEVVMIIPTNDKYTVMMSGNSIHFYRNGDFLRAVNLKGEEE